MEEAALAVGEERPASRRPIFFRDQKKKKEEERHATIEVASVALFSGFAF